MRYQQQNNNHKGSAELFSQSNSRFGERTLHNVNTTFNNLSKNFRDGTRENGLGGRGRSSYSNGLDITGGNRCAIGSVGRLSRFGGCVSPKNFNNSDSAKTFVHGEEDDNRFNFEKFREGRFVTSRNYNNSFDGRGGRLGGSDRNFGSNNGNFQTTGEGGYKNRLGDKYRNSGFKSQAGGIGYKGYFLNYF